MFNVFSSSPFLPSEAYFITRGWQRFSCLYYKPIRGFISDEFNFINGNLLRFRRLIARGCTFSLLPVLTLLPWPDVARSGNSTVSRTRSLIEFVVAVMRKAILVDEAENQSNSISHHPKLETLLSRSVFIKFHLY